MSFFSKSIFLLGIIFIIGYTSDHQKPDSNFKSIHQIEWEVHQEDTLDTITGVTLESNQKKQAHNVINSSLLVIIIIILILAIMILLIVRHVYKVRKE